MCNLQNLNVPWSQIHAFNMCPKNSNPLNGVSWGKSNHIAQNRHRCILSFINPSPNMVSWQLAFFVSHQLVDSSMAPSMSPVWHLQPLTDTHRRGPWRSQDPSYVNDDHWWSYIMTHLYMEPPRCRRMFVVGWWVCMWVSWLNHFLIGMHIPVCHSNR